MTSSIKSQDFSLPRGQRGTERRPGHTHTHAHVNTRIHTDTHAITPCTHTEGLSISTLSLGGGKPYQVISVKIDNDSIIVQILSRAPLARTSIQNTLPPSPRGSLNVLWCPPMVYTQGTKRLHKCRSYFCQLLLTCQKDRRPQWDGNSQRKDGADSLRSAGSDKSLCSLWVMFGFLVTNRGFTRCYTSVVWMFEVSQVALTFYHCAKQVKLL